MTDPSPVPLTTTHILTLRVDISAPVVIGPSDHGARRFIPITGGTFTGAGPAAGVQGRVLHGGADWQLTRADGITEVDAHYTIETDDGVVIIVRNRGLVDRSAERSAQPYVRTTPRFQAPEGSYGWLNRSLFAGTIRVAADLTQVIISVFRID